MHYKKGSITAASRDALDAKIFILGAAAACSICMHRAPSHRAGTTSGRLARRGDGQEYEYSPQRQKGGWPTKL